MRVPLASPNFRPQERSCKAPGFAHQPQKEQKPQRGLFGGEAVSPGCLCQTLPLSQIHLLLSTFLPLPSSPRHCSPGCFCNPVPSNFTRAMGL